MQPKVEIEHNDTQDMHKETEKKLMGSWEGSQEDENAGFLILRTFVMWAGEEDGRYNIFFKMEPWGLFLYSSVTF